MKGEVGLLSRNIVIEGKAYNKQEKDEFGGRVLVSTFTTDGVDYTGLY